MDILVAIENLHGIMEEPVALELTVVTAILRQAHFLFVLNWTVIAI